MGLFDHVKEQCAAVVQSHLSRLRGQAATTEGEAAGDSTAMLDQVCGFLGQQGLGGLVQKFRERGFDDMVSSWIGTGANLPISGEQIQQVFNVDTLRSLSAKLGMHPEQVSALLAQILPQVVDTMTPEGRLPEGEEAPAPTPSSGQDW